MAILTDLIASLTALKKESLENLVQGHGDVLLRGEIDETLDAQIDYLRCVDRQVRERIARGVPRNGLNEITVEDCGLSRIPLGGLANRLHQANLMTLYDAYRSEIKARRRFRGNYELRIENYDFEIEARMADC